MSCIIWRRSEKFTLFMTPSSTAGGEEDGVGPSPSVQEEPEETRTPPGATLLPPVLCPGVENPPPSRGHGSPETLMRCEPPAVSPHVGPPLSGNTWSIHLVICLA